MDTQKEIEKLRDHVNYLDVQVQALKHFAIQTFRKIEPNLSDEDVNEIINNLYLDLDKEITEPRPD